MRVMWSSLDESEVVHRGMMDHRDQILARNVQDIRKNDRIRKAPIAQFSVNNNDLFLSFLLVLISCLSLLYP